LALEALEAYLQQAVLILYFHQLLQLAVVTGVMRKTTPVMVLALEQTAARVAVVAQMVVT
jgi:hypothetical protein